MIAKVLICTHKQWEMRSDDIYTPIHVGKALSDLDLGIIGDDTGDNISKKNPNYCELTAEYWAWKNLKCDYIGLEHYRRHFDFNFTEKNIEKLMKGVDVVLPKPVYHFDNICSELSSLLTREDFVILYRVLEKKGVKMSVVDKYLTKNMAIRFNMFFMRKELFDEFAQWQFDILNECEKYVRLSPYVRLRRIFGYFGETLLPIWCMCKGLRVKYLTLNPEEVDCEKWNMRRKLKYRIGQLIFKYIFNVGYRYTKLSRIYSSTLVGLEQDGIKI